MMAERHRLRDLQMSEAGHHRLGMLIGAFDQCALQSADCVDCFIARVPDPKPEIGRDLIIP